MTSKPDELRELIPLYLNGRLSEHERQEFEDALKVYPELKHELMELSEIKDLYREMEREIPPVSENLYAKILSNIRPLTDKEKVKERKGYTEQLLESLKGLFSSPRLSWTVVAAQLVIILFLLTTMPEKDGFRTLTSQSTSQGELTRINVVFKEDAREKEIRGILNAFGATIVSGPSPEGLYTIEIKEDKKEVVLERLRSSGIVKFVERAY